MAPTPPASGGPSFKKGQVPYKDLVGEGDEARWVHGIEESWHWFELNYNNRVLKHTIKLFGQQLLGGYPLFIGLHGGGSNSDGLSNNRSWIDASKRYFHDRLIDQTTSE